MKLELGGGTRPLPGYFNLDLMGGYDITTIPWPKLWMPSDGVDHIYTSHCLEHTATEHRIAIFNECYKWLKPGCLFDIIVPKFPTFLAIADPTHKSYFVKESFDYFCGKNEFSPHADYGIKEWEMVNLIELTYELRATLRKPTNA